MLSPKTTKISFAQDKYDFIVVWGLVFGAKRQRMVKFVVDTGASTTMIDPAIMESVGYGPQGTEYMSSASVSGPAGKQFGYKVKIHQLLIHSAQCVLPNVDVVCIRPERNVEALLGLNFLKHFRYCVDHKKQLLTLETNFS